MMRLIWFDSGCISEAGLLLKAVKNSMRENAAAHGKDLGAHAPWGRTRPACAPRAFSVRRLRLQWLINFRASWRVGQLPHGGEDGSRNFLHLLVIDLIGVVPRHVVIFVHARKVEDDRDAFLSVIVMIAAIKEAFGVVRIVVFVI